MILCLSVSTDMKDLIIDYIEVKLVTGEIASLNWDESEVGRTDDGFTAQYKGVCFDEEHANGKLESLRGMQIACLGVYSESKNYSDLVITDMLFTDDGEQYEPKDILPCAVPIEQCEFT